MSKLRKSASFRSRIPIRNQQRNHTQRRFFSPYFTPGEHYDHHQHQHHRNHFDELTSHHIEFNANLRRCSSSYSSSDESCESDQTHQRLVTQYSTAAINDDILMHTSTDAISLDGLLDNVSCCSNFSNPPSPPSQSTSILKSNSQQRATAAATAPIEPFDRINEAIESIDLSKTIRFCTAISTTPATEVRENSTTEELANVAIRPYVEQEISMVTMETPQIDEATTASSNYSEKQRNLSDWYYVKAKTDTSTSTTQQRPSTSGGGASLEKRDETGGNATVGAAGASREMTKLGGLKKSDFMLSHCGSAQSLPRPSMTVNTATYSRKSSRRHDYETVTSTSSTASARLKKSTNQSTPEVQNDGRANEEYVADGSGDVQTHKIPPYYCPPDYSTFHAGCTKHLAGATANATNTTSALSKVNIKLLREQYEHQGAESSSLPQPLRSPTLTNAAEQPARDASMGRRNQSRIDAQLRHWESISTNNNNNNNEPSSHSTMMMPTTQHQHQHQQRPRPRPRPLQLQQTQQYANLLEHTRSEQQPASPPSSSSLSSPPIAAPRRFVPPLVVTPRPVQRSKVLQRCLTDEHVHDNDGGGAGVRDDGERLILLPTIPPPTSSALSSPLCVRRTAVVVDSSPSSPVATQRVKHPICDSPRTAIRRPLPPTPLQEQQQQQQQQQQLQIKLQQNPVTRQLFGVVQDEVFHPKTPVYRSDGELSGSYASLECPSPPGPPACLPDAHKDPQVRLSNFLRNYYQELSFKEPIIPPWIMPVTPGILCASRLEPDLRLNTNSHGFSETISVDQILVSLQTKEGNFLEAPRRCLIECPAWVSRSNLCLRILHAWAKEPPWPSKGTPVAVTLFIPLRELKRSFAQYIEKEILPKGPMNPFLNASGGFSVAWNSLEALGPKLLIILDGYTNQKINSSSASNVITPKKGKATGFIGGSTTLGKHHYPADVHDLLEGRLFPEARIIITTNVVNCMELMPMVQRHIMYDGLTWGRSASILDGGHWDGTSRLLDIIQESVHLRNAVRSPLGCLAIAAIYETSNGDLPIEELDVIETIVNCIAPEASSATISELGRLALFCLKMKRTAVTMAEIKMYCATPDKIMGCMEKSVLYGKSAKKKADYVFNPICPCMLEYLAANYIASLASRPGLLAAEITGMAIGDEIEPDLLKVLKFAMTLLGEQAHILLSRLTPLWLTPHTVFTLALAGGQRDTNLAALCDILGISKHPPISPLETKPLWVQVRSMPTDLMGWGMALKSPTCTLKNLEIIYQLDKQKIVESRKAIEIFLDSIAVNESVLTLRLSSLIEMDVKDSEISYLSNCVSKLLLKPRLEHFELVLTLIEEDPPLMKLQPVVAALCRTIPRQTKLNSLLLDLGLSTSQLVQLCAAIEKCPNITRLSLPHLRCERGAVAALAALLNVKPINFLSLPSCWGVRDDPPSSSGVSMGSGSGSSTGTSCLIKQGSLPGVPSPRSYAPGIFSSLPRGVFVPQSSLGRSATLPRQPMEPSLEKRSCDSVVSKVWYPTPSCEGGPHNAGTMHDLFFSIRTKLHSLDLSKAQLSLEDAMCLGETVRLSNTLHTLKFEGSARVSEVLPTVLGASESPCLQMLSIGSQRLNLEDSMAVICARALTSCVTLRLLSLDGWCFRIEHAQSFAIIRAFLSLTSIRELSLSNCRLQTNLIRKDVKPVGQLFESRSLVVLKLAGAQVILTDMTVLRGPQLLPYISGFTYLRELDLSAPARSGIESTHTSPLILDDKSVVQFFQHLHSHFSLLNTLKICNWIMHFDEFSKTLKTIAKALRNSPISHLKLDGISVLDRPKKQRNEATFIHCFIASLPHLRWLGISLSSKKEEQITALGSAVLDLKGTEIEIKLSESTIDQAKLMAQAISIDGKFDIKVSTFGTSSGILIHAEKCGIKSLSRKTKEKDQYF